MFQVELTFPAGVSNDNNLPPTTEFPHQGFLCLPPPWRFDVPFRGRKLKVAGDREFQTGRKHPQRCYFGLRSGLEEWSERIQNHNALGATELSDYGHVFPARPRRPSLRAYSFEGIWPGNRAIGLDFEANNA